MGTLAKGALNKIPALLKDEILEAAAAAHPEGRVGYLTQQAQDNPAAFMMLLRKILPTQVEGPGDNGAILFKDVTRDSEAFTRRVALLRAQYAARDAKAAGGPYGAV